jgi:hypothetical protein
MVTKVESALSRLQGGNYFVTSQRADAYNCIAWAAGDTTIWWWPDDPNVPGKAHWPDGAARAETLEAFRAGFAILGYGVCQGEERQPGFEKVALFADALGVPRHAARQLPNGRWTSKLGPLEDIEHALHDLEGTAYGIVVLVMKRPVLQDPPPEQTEE